jgi:poly-beta-1,6-N-acetyl-D-glucosamine synthase
LIFFGSVAVIAYTYFLYPAILVFISRVKKSHGAVSETSFLPRVAMVVSVYNEEQIIEEKLQNTVRIDYPSDMIRFVFGSDGSDDRTNEIMARHEDERFDFRLFKERRGKARVLNDLVPCSDAEVIVLSDANTFYEPDAVGRLVRHFRDPGVGAVCGQLVLDADNRTAGGWGEGNYWQYENFLKRLESEISTTLGGVGPLYAIRKDLFVPLPTTKVITDDLLIPLNIIKKGFKMKYDEKAIASEKPANSVKGEFRRKVRISVGNFHGIAEFWPLLNPKYGFVSFALWSHKILRWSVPFLLIAVAISSALLAMESLAFKYLVMVEGVFVLAALLGLLLEILRMRSSVVGLVYYFLATNAALLVGFFKFLFGRQRPTWDVVR